jgi:hypothetical protein
MENQKNSNVNNTEEAKNSKKGCYTFLLFWAIIIVLLVAVKLIFF